MPRHPVSVKDPSSSDDDSFINDETSDSDNHEALKAILVDASRLGERAEGMFMAQALIDLVNEALAGEGIQANVLGIGVFREKQRKRRTRTRRKVMWS